MDRRGFELKVGIFVLIGIIILFIMVFSIGDVYFVKSGYYLNVVFNFASGLLKSAPVRVAGVNVGQVEEIRLFRDTAENKTKAMVRAWIQSDTKIEEDAKITVNTLGLLGEKYLEIMPGTSGKRCFSDGEKVIGQDPVSMEEVTRNLKTVSDSAVTIVERLKNGEGTIGKLLTKDKVYADLEQVSGSCAVVMKRLENGEGTVGKFLTDESVYTNIEEFTADIKQHPWKLLQKSKEETEQPRREVNSQK